MLRDGDTMVKIIASFCLVIVMMELSSPITAQSGGTFSITKSVIAGGGGRVAGGTFTVDGTIGQSVAGTTSAGGAFSLKSGL